MIKETSLEIDATAADWAARADRGTLTSGDEKLLEAWLEGDTRRRGAFMRMRAISLYTERARALGAGFDPDAFIQNSSYSGDGRLDGATPIAGHREDVPESRSVIARISRRGMLSMAGGVAACLAGVVGFSLVNRGTRFDTRRGEVRVVSLDDGSVITLNTASRVDVRFADNLRLVRLMEGEALFDVAKDKTRPFVVEAGDTRVRAVGTSFAVKRLADKPIQIIVREGIVEVRRTSAPAPVHIAANMLATLGSESSDAAPVRIPIGVVNRELAWREGRIAFEGETLDQAAAAFARYSDTRIVIDDPMVGREEITGLFASNDPVTFAQAAANSLGLHAEVGAGEVRIGR